MNEHRIARYVEEYLLVAQEPEPPDRSRYVSDWCARLHTDCVQTEVNEVFRRISNRMKAYASIRPN